MNARVELQPSRRGFLAGAVAALAAPAVIRTSGLLMPVRSFALDPVAQAFDLRAALVETLAEGRMGLLVPPGNHFLSAGETISLPPGFFIAPESYDSPWRGIRLRSDGSKIEDLRFSNSGLTGRFGSTVKKPDGSNIHHVNLVEQFGETVNFKEETYSKT